MFSNSFNKYDLALLQRSLNRCYNLRMKLINSKALEDLEELLSKKDITYSIPNLDISYCDIVNEIKNFLIVSRVDNYCIIKPTKSIADFYGEKCKKRSNSDKFICPQFESSKFGDHKFLTNIIFTVLPEGCDPLFYELRDQFPVIKLYVRYYYLSLVYFITQDSILNNFELIICDNPIGYHELIVTKDTVCRSDDSFGFYPIISNFWLIDEVQHHIGFESRIKNIVNDIEDRTNKRLDNETWQYLLSQLVAYSSFKIDTLRSVRKNIVKVLGIAASLCADPLYNEWDSTQKINLFDRIPFIVSLKIKKLFQGYTFEALNNTLNELNIYLSGILNADQPKLRIFDALFSNHEQRKDQLIRDKLSLECLRSGLAGLNREIYPFNVRIKILRLSNCGIELSRKKDRPLNLLTIDSMKIEDDFDLRLIKIEDDNEISVQTNVKTFNISGFIEKLQYYINKNGRDNITKTNAIGRIFFNILRYELEKIEVLEFGKQYNLITKFAMQKVMADEVFLFSYSEFDQVLIIESVSCNKMLGNSKPEIECKKIMESILIHSSEFYQALKDCILKNEIISKYRSTEHCLFANCVDNNFMEYWNPVCESFPYKDFMLLPLMSHNRRLGVLAVLSYHRNHFNMLDRLLITDFVHNVSNELFESKLFMAIQHINSHKDTSYKYIAEELIKVFNASDVVILLNKENDVKEVLAYCGNKFSNKFRENDLIAKNELEFLIEMSNKIQSFSRGDSVEEYYSGISIPLIYGGTDEIPFGYIILFDSQREGFSESLYRECVLLGHEVSHVIWENRNNEKQMEQMRSLIAHDVGSQLRSISGFSHNIDKWLRHLTDANEVADKIRYSARDISNATETAKYLIDYFTTGLLEKDQLTDDNWLTCGIRKYVESYQKHMTKGKCSDLDYILKEICFGHKSMLKSKDIKWEISGSFPGPLWIDENLARQVIGNMISNVVKYALSGSHFFIRAKQGLSGWLVYIENESIPLTTNQETIRESIFENGVRFVEGGDGTGKGLYFAKKIMQMHGGDITLEYKKVNEKIGVFKFCLYFHEQLTDKENPFKI